MEGRINIEKLEPGAYKAMYALENYLGTTRLSKTHRDLIKIRASQINNCAYCIDLHTREALKNGETNQRIFLVQSWRETNLFTEAEKVLLAVTEEVTLINKQGLSNETYKKATEVFDDNFIAQVVIAVSTINAWNRIAISTNMGFRI